MPGSTDEDDVAWAEYRPLLFSIAYGMTGSVGDAEDIVQDAFVGLTRREGTIDRIETMLNTGKPLRN